MVNIVSEIGRASDHTACKPSPEIHFPGVIIRADIRAQDERILATQETFPDNYWGLRLSLGRGGHRFSSLGNQRAG